MKLQDRDLKQIGAVHLAIMLDLGWAMSWPPELYRGVAKVLRRRGGETMLAMARDSCDVTLPGALTLHDRGGSGR